MSGGSFLDKKWPLMITNLSFIFETVHFEQVLSEILFPLYLIAWIDLFHNISPKLWRKERFKEKIFYCFTINAGFSA